jgi:hypothetical protein
MRKEHLREFAGRPRQAVAEAKANHWKARHDADPIALMTAAHAAFEHARSVADFPPHHYLEADLAHHIELKRLIDRASSAFTVR